MAYCLWLLKREQSYRSKRAASFTLKIRISSMSEILFKKSNFAHKLILKTYLGGMYLAFFLQFWLLHFQKHTHILMRYFSTLAHSALSSSPSVPLSPPSLLSWSLCQKRKLCWSNLDANVLSLSSSHHKDFSFGKFYREMANQIVHLSQS